MIPSDLFFDLIDSQAGFSVRSGKDEIRVTAPRLGQVSLLLDGDQWSADASSVHSRLNFLLARSDTITPLSLDASDDVYLDLGQSFRFSIIPKLGRRGREERPAAYELKAEVIWSGQIDGELQGLLEIRHDGKASIRHYAVSRFHLEELQRISRFAPPRHLHERVAARPGAGWNEAPFAEPLFVEMYGEGERHRMEAVYWEG